MKKRNCFILLCSLMALMLFGVGRIDADAASKTKTRNTVYKAITSVKSGKYIYYNDGTAIYRENAKGKRTKLSKYKADGDFIISGDYIYYHSKTNSKIYRMTKTGKKQKKYSLSALGIRMVKGGYIYYDNSMGLNRISTSGKKSTKKKLLSYSKNSGSVIIGSRIFYTTYKRIEKTGKEDVYTYYIRSMDLKGKDKKMHGTFVDADSIVIKGDSRYLNSLVKLKTGYEIGVIDIKAKGMPYTKLQVIDSVINKNENMDETKECEFIAVIDGILYYQKEDKLYSMTAAGKMKELINLPTENVQGVQLVKTGSYYWMEFNGDDTFGFNYIYDKDWKLVKKLTQKYGDVIDLKIKSKKAYVIFNKSEDESPLEKYMTYKIYKLK